MGSRILKQDIIAQLNYLNGLQRYRRRDTSVYHDNLSVQFYNEAISVVNQGIIRANLIEKINNIFLNKTACRIYYQVGGHGDTYNQNFNYMYNRSVLSVPSGRIYESYFNAIKSSISNLANCHCYSNCHSNCESTSGCKDGR